MLTQKNLITLCFATVFTLGLAACGGGGGGDAPVTGMMDGDGSLEGKYIPSGTMIPVEDVPNIVITVDSGESETFAGLGTVECASDEGCSGTVVDGVLTIMGDLKIVSVDPALDSETATVLAGLAVDMLPDEPGPVVTPDPHACDAGPSQDCVDARQTELEAIENDSDATVGALNAAEMALADAETALADANTAAAEEMTVSGLVDDAMTATADITDESTSAEVAVGRAAIDAAQESLEGMDNLSADATTALQGRIDALEAGYSPIEMTVETNAATAAAATKRTAIAAEADQTDDAVSVVVPRLRSTLPAKALMHSPSSVTAWPRGYGYRKRRRRRRQRRCRVHAGPRTWATAAPCTLARWTRMQTAK